jgi:two-component system sensor histidine kinase PilS (NtrC family)
MKLAGLGRLTASIAHEIRNPLAAIDHANQLLGESAALSDQDRRLVEIVHNHAGRVNGIVENVLKLSRGGRLQVEELALDKWLREFAAEFSEQHALDDEDVRVTVHPGRAPLTARVDQSQLRQVVRNLAENALRYGVPKNITRYGERSLVELRLSIRPFRNQPCIEVLDQGSGVAADSAEQIFEPFYTSASQGTGLGLFIARELCECNHATLTYHARGNGGSCFRISFANAKNWVA